MPAKTFKTLLLGDVYGSSGCGVVLLKLSSLKKKYDADFVVINGENAAEGFGITLEQVQKLFDAGADVITSGNHIWQQQEIEGELERRPNLLRPANYGSLAPGHGFCVYNGVGVLNLIGRVNMYPIEDLFRFALDSVREIKKQTKLIFVDLHGESAEEKAALAFALDGQVSAVVGTHTHVQSCDEMILEKGTAFISDLGMCGPVDSVIGSDVEIAIRRQKTQMPIKSVPAGGACQIHGAIVTCDADTGKAISIERVVE